MRKNVAIVLLLALVFVAAACGSAEEADKGEVKLLSRATAFINPRSESNLGGSAIFIREGDRITVQVSIESAPPGEHAVHIHEIGDCSAPDATSAGGHWNPSSHDHGKWNETPFHLGDIGNIVAGEDGEGSITLTTDLWSIGSGESNDIMGKAVIVHAGPDDFTTQPTGAAGGRLGCGVINAG